MTEPRELPILFKPDLVRAIIEGRKTQTRRIMSEKFTGRCLDLDDPEDRERALLSCPYGQVGDLLYVRESHYLTQWVHERHLNDWQTGEPFEDFTYSNGGPVWYAADGDLPGFDRNAAIDACTEEWGEAPHALTYPSGYTDLRPSIHLPKRYARVWLRVTDVRIERVQDITGADAEAEGCASPPPDEPGPYSPEEGARNVFVELWDRINAKRGYGWDSNPWVWAVTFEVVSTTGRPS